MFYLIIILFGVGWILSSVVRNYSSEKSPISHKYLNHGTLTCLCVTRILFSKNKLYSSFWNRLQFKQYNQNMSKCFVRYYSNNTSLPINVDNSQVYLK